MSDAVICAIIGTAGIVLVAVINKISDWIPSKQTHPTQDSKEVVHDTVTTIINYNTYIMEKPSEKDGSLLKLR